jgi:hypothetical protein
MTGSKPGGDKSHLRCPGFTDQGPGIPGDAQYQRPNAPQVIFRGASVLLRDEATGRERVIEDLARVDNWALMSVFSDRGRLTAVFEELGTAEGRIAFLVEDGSVLELSKSLEPTDEGAGTWYRGRTKEEVLPGQPDVLRYELLQGNKDPDPDEVRACFPPVRRAFWEGLERPHTFIGTAVSADVIPHYYKDVPMVSRVPTEVVAPDTAEAIRAENLWEGLVGGWLPVIRTVYPVGEQECWEVLAFAPTEGATTFVQPAWYRYIKLNAGRVKEIKYIDSFLPYPNDAPGEPAEFYRSLLALHRYWHCQLDEAMTIRAPDEWIEDFSRHAIALEKITRRGNHPKYGVVERAYAGEEHDGFQDALTSTVICSLEWGLFSSARAYLDYYFEHFVRLDGSIRYRGPEMGKYGVMLSCLAQYCDYSQDYSLLCDHDQKIRAIVALLVSRWEQARRLDPEDPAYGMIKGRHEADISFLTPTLNDMDYERPYLSNSAEAWRGLRDIALSWQRVGQQRDDADMATRGAALAQSASALLVDARRGVERSWLEKDGVTGLPIIAGSSSFYWEAPYRSCPESYDENRVWSELLHSGVLPKEAVERILANAGARGGTTLGILTNRLHVVGFLVAEAVHGLLQHDLVPEALLVFYAHAFHAHTRGTWTAIECVDMDRDRAAHTPYCAPAQVTVPTIAKWLLVFEDPLDRTIILGQGVPRAWLAHGKEFGVERSPTRWGPVTYMVRSQLDEGRVDAEIVLPPRPGATVRLRLRCPANYVLERAEVLGRSELKARVDGDMISLPTGALGKVALSVWCAKAGPQLLDRGDDGHAMEGPRSGNAGPCAQREGSQLLPLNAGDPRSEPSPVEWRATTVWRPHA